MNKNEITESTINGGEDSNKNQRIITAIKIDVVDSTITEVEYESSDIESIHDLLECDRIDQWTMNQFNDILYVDDVGWLDRTTIGGFVINGNHFAGHGLVVGVNNEGEDINPSFTVEMLQRIVTFLGVEAIERIKEKHFQ